MEKELLQQLVRTAIKARQHAYAPYSRYLVGAAVLSDDGRIFGGCNVENASYGAACCAERSAVFKAVSEGARQILAAAVIGGPEEYGGEVSEEATPCGICRQVLREFSDPGKCEIIIAKSSTNYRITTLEALLPESFGPEHLRA